MQGQDFLLTAERLAKGLLESDWRSAVSRAYYAVFHHLRQFLLQQGLDLGRGGQAHFSLYTGLLNCGVPAAGILANRVDQLRSHRVSADYDLQKPTTQPMAQDAVTLARTLIADFQNLIKVNSPAHIVAGARKHLQAIGKLGKTP